MFWKMTKLIFVGLAAATWVIVLAIAVENSDRAKSFLASALTDANSLARALIAAVTGDPAATKAEAAVAAAASELLAEKDKNSKLDADLKATQLTLADYQSRLEYSWKASLSTKEQLEARAGVEAELAQAAKDLAAARQEVAELTARLSSAVGEAAEAPRALEAARREFALGELERDLSAARAGDAAPPASNAVKAPRPAPELARRMFSPRTATPTSNAASPDRSTDGRTFRY
jgi:chromosome segregation ATPase